MVHGTSMMPYEAFQQRQRACHKFVRKIVFKFKFNPLKDSFMNGSLGSPPRQKVTMTMIDSLPPIAKKEEIEYVMKNIYSFFRYPARLTYSFRPSAINYFVHPVYQDTGLTEDDAKEIDSFSKKLQTKMFTFLADRPHLCRPAVRAIPFRHFSSSHRKNFYYELMQIAFYSDSLELFKLAMIDTPAPVSKRKLRNPATAVIAYISHPDKVPGIFIEKESLASEFSHGLTEIASSTAVAASPTALFLGQKNGDVRVIVNKANVRCISYKNIVNEEYSLVWVHQCLWLITNLSAYRLDSLQLDPVLVEKPQKLATPVCTDGHYFYAFKKSEVHIFEYVESQFLFIRSLKLSPSVCRVGDEHEVPFVADGGLISFALPKKKEVVFRSYSLVTGALITTRVVSELPDLVGWCTRPFSNEHVLLSRNNVGIYRSVSQISRWIMGLSHFSAQNEGYTIENALELALHHGASFFENGSFAVLLELLKKFCNDDNDTGVKIIGHLLLRGMDIQSENSIPFVDVFADYFSKCRTKPEMQRFCCFMYLACLRNSGVAVRHNVLSEYLETNPKELDFLFAFPGSVRFSAMTPHGMEKLIEYCAFSWWGFQNEASYLIQEYIRNFVTPKFKKGDIESVLGPLEKIMNAISQTVVLALNGFLDSKLFASSSQFSVWCYVLLMIREAKKHWCRFGHQLIRLLQIGLYNQSIDRPNLTSVKDMMSRTMVVLLELISAVPKNVSYVQFKTTTEFYSKYPSVINGYNERLDQAIINLLDRSYDVFTESDYYSVFRELQRIILFDKGGDCEVLQSVPFERYSSQSLVEYFKTGRLEVLAPVQDPNVIDWCFKTLWANRPSFTSEQKIIMAIFLSSLREYIPIEMSIELPLDPKMLYSAQLYFLLPKAILTHYSESISSGYVMEMPPDMLAYCHEKIFLLQSRISQPKDFVIPLKNALQTKNTSLLPSFANVKQEGEHYREVLLWLLALEIGVPMDLSGHVNELRNYLWGGSYRVVDVFMRAIARIENVGLEVLFESLFEIVVSFCTRERNLFVMQDPSTIEPVTSLFAIVRYMKQMFNSKLGVFRSFLVEFAKNCDDKQAVAVFIVLNNSLEVPRKGVNVHFVYDSIDIVGVIDNVYYETMSFSISGKQYFFSKARELWCTPDVRIDLSLLDDVAIFTDLFVRIKYDDPVLSVFYYASLLEFIKNVKCLRRFPSEFWKRLAKMEYPSAFQMQHWITEFMFFLSLDFSPETTFSFVEMNTYQDRPKSSPLSSNCHRHQSKRFGTLMSLTKSTSFVSCPIHPDCALALKLTIYRSDSSITEVSVFGISKSLCGVLRTDIFEATEMTVVISFSPQRMLITIKQENKELRTATSSSIEMFFVVVKLSPNQIVDYECQFAEKPQRVESMPDCFSLRESEIRLMSFFENTVYRPFLDSSLFNRMQLLKCAQNVVESFKFLIVFYIHSKTTLKMPPKLALALLRSSNCFPTDETVNIDILPCTSLWMNHGRKFLQFVKKGVNELSVSSIESEFLESLKDYFVLPTKPNSNSSVYFRTVDPVELENAFVFVPSLTTPLQTIGSGSKPIYADSGCLIIPMNNVFGTVVETILTARHYLTLFIAKGNYNFDTVLKSFSEIKNRLPFTAPLFHRTIELIRAISPPLPKPFALPIFNDVSFFIPNSRIHSYPDNYLLHRYIDCVVKPQVFRGDVPITLKISHPSRSYLRIYSVEPVKHGLVFQVQEDDIVHPVPVNTFLILDHQKFTITCPDPEYNGSSVRFLVCPMPDSTGLSDAIHRWKPHHSHQLLLSIPEDKPMTLEMFRSLPLSTRFPFGAAKFILSLLRDQCINSCLDTYRNHLVQAGQSEVGRRCEVVTFANVSDEEFPSVRASEYCRRVADAATMTKERRLYLSKNHFCLYHPVHPNLVRLGASCDDSGQFRTNLLESIRVIRPGNPLERWIRNILWRMPTYALLMFIEFVTGKWEYTGVILLFYVSSPDTLESLHSERMLVMGRFRSEARLRRRLLLRLQRFNDRILEM